MNRGYVQAALLLLRAGASPNHRTQVSTTPLLRAAASGRADLVRLLLAHDAEIDAQDCEGFTALILAARFNHREVAKLLIDSGASLQLYSTIDETFL